MIDIKRVGFAYREQPPLFSDFSAAFAAGEIVAVSGKNGCGKTTLTKLMVGILRPSRGQILIDGEDIAALSLFAIGQRAGYLFQNPARQLFTSSAEEEIRFGLKNKGLDAAQQAEIIERQLTFFRLTHRRNAHPQQLSQGEKQRLALAAVLALGSRYLILDEPTGGLDMASRRSLGRLFRDLRDQGQGLVLVSHEREFIRRYADRELVLA